MELRTLMAPAAEAAVGVMDAVPADRLDAPTPCPEWDVRALVNHMIFWSGRIEGAAHKLTPPAEPGQDHDFTVDGDWAGLYAARVRKAAEAWSHPDAWEGTTRLTGEGTAMPAPFVGGILFLECVLHGWDLAVATGQSARFGDDLVRAAYAQLDRIADTGRKLGAFGPQVPVPESAPLLERLLGLAGRDPHWESGRA
ncbi:TIGR03086 family protein [Actinomadura rubrobrunea]|uniref:TIGR03086 family protein n=1 Tax=Actinomadura rubrobrunea TaxID=115335 RepID=A0A9W6PTT3_9ACTN|nr:TIGR03086 family metal-binding protein [Actinomadura rubrobrunea]GLW63427.1 TIGR03086 family protein [Actinomadura rubrobrunea]